MGMELDSSSDDDLPTVEAATKEIPVVNRSQGQDDDRSSEDERNAEHDRELEDIMSSHIGATKQIKKSKAEIQKEQMQMQLEKERLMRSSTFNVDQRFKKQTLSSLLESAQSKL
jgi:phosphatidate phosphatase PAH1